MELIISCSNTSLYQSRVIIPTDNNYIIMTIGSLVILQKNRSLLNNTRWCFWCLPTPEENILLLLLFSSIVHIQCQNDTIRAVSGTVIVIWYVINPNPKTIDYSCFKDFHNIWIKSIFCPLVKRKHLWTVQFKDICCFCVYFSLPCLLDSQPGIKFNRHNFIVKQMEEQFTQMGN